MNPMATRNSLVQKFQNTINKCDICYCEYNRHEKQPVIICTMHHTICRQCMAGLEQSRKCPYCREDINFSKVVVNNYIFELLPNDPPQPNARTEIRPALPQLPPQIVPNSINYQPQQPVYPPNYLPAPQQNEYFQDDYFPYDEHPFQVSNFCESIDNQLRFNNQPERKGIYIVIFILQLPYLIFDFYFSQTGTDHQCFDTPYVTRAYVLRPWLLSMGICEATFIFILFTAATLKICGFIGYGCLRGFQFIVLGLITVKILLWLYMELALFSSVIGPHCSGGVYAYGVFQTVVHGLFLLILGFMSLCK